MKGVRAAGVGRLGGFTEGEMGRDCLSEWAGNRAGVWFTEDGRMRVAFGIAVVP